MTLHLDALWKKAIEDLLIGMFMFVLPLAWRKMSDQEIDREYLKLLIEFVGTGVAIIILADAFRILTVF